MARQHLTPVTTADSSYYADYFLRPYNPDELFQRFGGYSTHDEMREDDQIRAVLGFQKSLIVNTGYSVVCENRDAADFATWVFDRLNLIQGLTELLTALDYGWAVSEPVWQILDTPYGKRICCCELRSRPPHSFEIDQDRYGTVTALRQVGRSAEIRVPLDRVVVFTHNPEFGNPYGRSMLTKGVYSAWWAKQHVQKFWNIYLERHGAPTVVATYDPAKVREASISDLQDVIKNLQTKTGISVPDGIKIELLDVVRSGSDGFRMAIDQYNMQIARAMLVPDLVGIGGSETSGGSYALGEKHFRLFVQSLEKTRSDLARVITRQLLVPLVRWNFGESLEPVFQFEPILEDDEQRQMDLLLRAVEKGVIKVNLDDENWLRGRLGLTEVDERAQPQPVAMPADDEPAAEPEAEPDEATVDEAEGKEYARRDFKTIGARLDETETALVRTLGEVIRGSVTQYMDELDRRKVISGGKLKLLRTVELRNFGGPFRSALRGAFRDMLAFGRQTAQAEAEVKDNIAGAGQPAFEMRAYLDELSQQITDDEMAAMEKMLRQTVMGGIQQGLGTLQIRKKLSEVMAGYDIASQPHRLETIVRNNVTRVYNEGRQRYFEALGPAVVGYVYSAIMDGRTTIRCQGLHGKVIRPEVARNYMPPLHHNCRSVLLPILAGERAEYDALDDPGGFS